jgi:hypothetical protein
MKYRIASSGTVRTALGFALWNSRRHRPTESIPPLAKDRSQCHEQRCVGCCYHAVSVSPQRMDNIAYAERRIVYAENRCHLHPLCEFRLRLVNEDEKERLPF